MSDAPVSEASATALDAASEAASPTAEIADAFDADFEVEHDDAATVPAHAATAAARLPAEARTAAPLDPPTVSLFRVASSSAIAMDLHTLLTTAAHEPGVLAVLELKDVPRARLARCRHFLHLLDSDRAQRVDSAAAAIAAEEVGSSIIGVGGGGGGGGGGPEVLHAQLVQALQIARNECTQLREERRQRLIDQNRMRGENRALQAQVDQLLAAAAAAASSQTPTSSTTSSSAATAGSNGSRSSDMDLIAMIALEQEQAAQERNAAAAASIQTP